MVSNTSSYCTDSYNKGIILFYVLSIVLLGALSAIPCRAAGPAESIQVACGSLWVFRPTVRKPTVTVAGCQGCQAGARASGICRSETQGKLEWKMPQYSLLKVFCRLLRILSFICSQDSIANGATVITRSQKLCLFAVNFMVDVIISQLLGIVHTDALSSANWLQFSCSVI